LWLRKNDFLVHKPKSIYKLNLHQTTNPISTIYLNNLKFKIENIRTYKQCRKLNQGESKNNPKRKNKPYIAA